MRKILSLFALALAVPAWGQDATSTPQPPAHSESRCGFGFHGGWNFNNFNITNSSLTQAKNNTTGWLAGIHMEGWNMEPFSIRIEADYRSEERRVGKEG